ncbi:483_t:CDS:2, partial [Acaulospora morrowiae]
MATVRRVNARHHAPNGEQTPLIPVNICSAHQQRFLAVTIYGVLLALKAYTVILFYWCLLDALFFFGLYTLRIPWLQKSLWFWLLCFFVSCLINASLINPLWVYDVELRKHVYDVFSSSSLLIQQQYLRLRGEKVRAVSSEENIQIEDVRYNSSHIKGKHTVRLLPFASAKLNPDDERLCLQRNDKKKFIELPILFNRTYPYFITYSRVDFEAGAKTLHQFSSKDIEQHRIVDVIQDGVYVYIPINQPGAYRIEEASDEDEMGIKIYNRQEVIVYCPSAELVPKSDLSLCFDDVIEVDLVLE